MLYSVYQLLPYPYCFIFLHHYRLNDILTNQSVFCCSQILFFHLLSFQFIRQSTDGLSLPMFVLAVLGNITYSLGILLVSVEPIFILRKLPWLIGSIGTFCLDFTVSFLSFSFPCSICFVQCQLRLGHSRPY